MRKVTEKQAASIAWLEYDLWLRKRTRMTEPRLPRAEWVKTRAADIMRRGALDSEIGLLEGGHDGEAEAEGA